MTNNALIEYKLEINLPELGSKDSMNVTINLDNKPGLSSIIGNFYRFLVRLGINQDLIDSYITIPGEEDFEEEEESIDWDSAKSKVISDIEETILNNSTDEKKKEEFLRKIKENKEFTEEVFRVFLSSLMSDGEDEIH